MPEATDGVAGMCMAVPTPTADPIGTGTGTPDGGGATPRGGLEASRPTSVDKGVMGGRVPRGEEPRARKASESSCSNQLPATEVVLRWLLDEFLTTVGCLARGTVPCTPGTGISMKAEPSDSELRVPCGGAVPPLRPWYRLNSFSSACDLCKSFAYSAATFAKQCANSLPSSLPVDFGLQAAAATLECVLVLTRSRGLSSFTPCPTPVGLSSFPQCHAAYEDTLGNGLVSLGTSIAGGSSISSSSNNSGFHS
mmetsp:Transcript_85596/g.187991  ORF Transcript_85596/g.187991 Transcript_85596/m.187991 type:complete len:252 (+) Transcript_85596:245-1000(+)